MKIMMCPLNGPRNISEFTYGGEFKPMPDPVTCSDAEWADYVFNTDNLAGWSNEPLHTRHCCARTLYRRLPWITGR